MTTTPKPNKPPRSPEQTAQPIPIPKGVQNLILDLDETLISGIEIPPLKKDATKMADFQRRKQAFTVHQMGEEYFIVERPGVQSFLDMAFKHYNVSIWTAASKEYAIFVYERVFQRPGRKLDYFMYSENCDDSYARTGCLKQLNQLFHLPQYNPDNTMIIDDNHNVYEGQKNLVHPIKPFRFFRKDSEKDDYLKRFTPTK